MPLLYRCHVHFTAFHPPASFRHATRMADGTQLRQRKPNKSSSPPKSSDSPSDLPMPTDPSTKVSIGGGTKALTAEQTKKAENKCRKILVRLVVGWAMIFTFYGIVWLGHGWVTVLVFALEVQIFSELMNVRYMSYQHKKMTKELKEEVKLFRTVQWGWFFVAMFYAYGEAGLTYALLGDRKKMFEQLVGIELPLKEVMSAKALQYHKAISFLLYSIIFVATILSFKRGVIRYQMGQLTWTLMTTMLVSVQMNFCIQNIFEGLFWFVLPVSLVVANDCFAYFCGMAAGGKIFRTANGEKLPFLPFLSPNKTWEGFVGAFFWTTLFGFAVFPVAYSQFKWLICPLEELPVGKIVADEASYTCPTPIPFQYVDYHILDYELFDYLFGPSVKEQFSAFTVSLMPCQLYGMWLAAFGSSVAPFGGFFASAIKRAYEIKDFDSIIPGHGGLMDRMDCQFLMSACTYVFYQSFIKPSMQLSVMRDILKAILALSPDVQQQIHEKLGEILSNHPST